MLRNPLRRLPCAVLSLCFVAAVAQPQSLDSATSRKGVAIPLEAAARGYHHPSDDLSTIDFDHMTGAIASMPAPIRWLADNSFKPAWNPGGSPAAKDASKQP